MKWIVRNIKEGKTRDDSRTIAGLIKSTPMFSTLSTAVKTAGLLDTLKEKGPFTVFAPTNDAFDKIDKEIFKALLDPDQDPDLTNTLNLHIVPGEVWESGNIPDGTSSLLTQAFADIKVTKRGRSITVKSRFGGLESEAKVIGVDLIASNGVIHWIDSVLNVE